MTGVSGLSIGPIRTPAADESAQRQQIALAAREFEALFLQQMLQQMRRSMLSEEVKEQGLGADTMTATMDAELARHLAGQPGGLYDVLVQAFAGYAAPPASPYRPAASSMVPPASGPPVLEQPAGPVSSEFGWRTDPISGGRRFHNGVDIAAKYGTDVPSAGQGRVVFAGVQGGYGQTVVLEHAGGLQTRYAHLSHIAVKDGDVVEKGAVLGRVGSSGRSTGAHLHFELLHEGRPVDPGRAESLAASLKVNSPVADYPHGTARAVGSLEE